MVDNRECWFENRKAKYLELKKSVESNNMENDLLWIIYKRVYEAYKNETINIQYKYAQVRANPFVLFSCSDLM